MKRSRDFAARYASALSEYLHGRDESALRNAYELGRRALVEGAGVLDVAGFHEEALANRLRQERCSCEANTVELGGRFLLESLSPFEMTHRGFRESYNELQLLNETLEQRVSERTAEADAARKDAERANRSKSAFLAVMSHELRTPLNAVLGYADLLEAGISGPLTAGQKAQIARIQASAGHLLELIEEILVFAKIETGREKATLEPVDLNAIMKDAAALIEPMAARQGLEFRLELPDYPVTIRSDARKIRQILLNLLSNAVKFTEQGSVTLTAHAGDEWVHMRVDDTGIGIAEEHLERIFDSFWQVEETATRRKGGTGLGLSVARQLAQLLGGTVTARSLPGRGSSFELRLQRTSP